MHNVLKMTFIRGWLLTSAKASNRGIWSHLRKPSDLAQRVMSAELSSGTLGNNSEAIRWNTWEWWKLSFPKSNDKGSVISSAERVSRQSYTKHNKTSFIRFIKPNIKTCDDNTYIAYYLWCYYRMQRPCPLSKVWWTLPRVSGEGGRTEPWEVGRFCDSELPKIHRLCEYLLLKSPLQAPKPKSGERGSFIWFQYMSSQISVFI